MARSGLRRLTWISIHAPREGCDACPVTWSAAQRRISIHAPREGCDGRRPDRRPSSPDFNPRTPRGVRLGQGPQGGLVKEISIHAPREGCDISRRSVADDKQNFNPRTPRGVRQLLSCLQNSLPRRFQSTHPARGATLGEQQGCPSMRFQSTHPARGATSKVDLVFQQAKISIHAPREGCDLG